MFDPHFFIIRTSLGHWPMTIDQWVKIVSILVTFSPSYSKFTVVSRKLTPRSMILRRVNLEKTRITRPNLNQNRNYLNLLLSGPGRLKLWKTGRKSCCTVPLNRIRKSHMTLRIIILRGVWYCAEIQKNSNISAKKIEVENLVELSI